MPSFTLSRRRALIAAGCALAAVVLAARLLGSPGSASSDAGGGLVSTSSVPALTAPSQAALAASSSALRAPTVVVVDVVGAVRRPGLYRLRQGTRIADAVARAGGLSRAADSTLVNLAAPLADGEQVLVPARAGAPGVVGAGSAGASSSTPVDLNTATVEQLDALPGIGPVTAQKIIDYRQEHGPFTAVDDLDAIPGIGPSRIDNLRGLVIP